MFWGFTSRLVQSMLLAFTRYHKTESLKKSSFFSSTSLSGASLVMRCFLHRNSEVHAEGLDHVYFRVRFVRNGCRFAHVIRLERRQEFPRLVFSRNDNFYHSISHLLPGHSINIVFFFNNIVPNLIASLRRYLLFPYNVAFSRGRACRPVFARYNSPQPLPQRAEMQA